MPYPAPLQHVPILLIDVVDFTKAADAAPPAPAGPRLRVLILIGHSVEDPLPRAVEMAKVAARDFESSHLLAEVRVDQASLRSLRREARRGCDLLIYYGHGTDDGHLSFVDGRKAFTHLDQDAGLGDFWRGLPACFLFACYGDRFAEHLPGPWVAFSEPILTAAPKGFLHALVPALAGGDLAAAVASARRSCEDAMQSDFTSVMRFSEAPLPGCVTPSGFFLFPVSLSQGGAALALGCWIQPLRGWRRSNRAAILSDSPGPTGAKRRGALGPAAHEHHPNPERVLQESQEPHSHRYFSSYDTPYFLRSRRNSSWKDSCR